MFFQACNSRSLVLVIFEILLSVLANGFTELFDCLEKINMFYKYSKKVDIINKKCICAVSRLL